MPYKWVNFGDEKSKKVLAIVALSNAHQGKEGQEKIKQRIDVLTREGFCVWVPQFSDGNLLIEEEVDEKREESRISGTFTPAVSAETGVRQFIECLQKGIDIMPLMGGDNFEKKIPHIIKYYEEHPEEKRPHIRLYGFSNATWGVALMSHGICNFISTPFASVFILETQDETYRDQAQQLRKLLNFEKIDNHPRKILYNHEDKLAQITETFHYPFNAGVLWSEVDEKNCTNYFSPPQDQKWSMSFEGYMQQSANNEKNTNPSWGIKKFLEKHKDNLPQFIELGNLATRKDGTNGYSNLQYNEDGEILANEYNLRKLGHLNVEDAKKLILEQNQLIKVNHEKIIAVAKEFGVPVILNTSNGHCHNMSVVNSGHNKVSLKDGKVEMEMDDLTLVPRKASAQGMFVKDNEQAKS